MRDRRFFILPLKLSTYYTHVPLQSMKLAVVKLYMRLSFATIGVLIVYVAIICNASYCEKIFRDDNANRLLEIGSGGHDTG